MITDAEFQELIGLYAEFHTAIDPFDPEMIAAEERFWVRLRDLHEARAEGVEFPEFRRFVVRRAVEFLRKN